MYIQVHVCLSVIDWSLSLPLGTASSTVCLLDGEFKIVQALYDYNPFKQSRNPNPDEELTFQEGDYIYVRKVPNEDGFYEVCVNWRYNRYGKYLRLFLFILG